MTIDQELEAFEGQRATLEKHHMGKFVVFKGGTLIGAFDTFDNAASVAVQMFGRGPYLIKQVGAPPAHLPASVLYRAQSPYVL